ncbi:hypothetical protein LSH36_342g02006 [Paralvinella palmiformis]|uniref:DUF7402 domain-containing protein n=1 Tax=Paralvinella palmiformis TaxID=53620 RepID=A0AAD9JFK6_9ANNE|nr:hypothetical protein LSH36_342g02006 [Paralvinella palmiformis]
MTQLNSNESDGISLISYLKRNKDCKCVVYEEGNQCYLYGTSEGSIPLAAGHVAIVEIEREPTSAKDMNLCIQPDVYCDTSSYYSGYPCEAAIDGILVAGIGKEWASAGEMNGAWIKVTFPRWAVVKQMKVLHRCAVQDQYEEFFFEFSDKTITTGNVQCTTNTNSRICPQPERPSAITLLPPRMTKSIKLTGSKTCSQMTGSRGFREVMYIGRLIEY